MNKRLENKITKWYGDGVSTSVWLAKHWHRWITYGCSMCWIDTCDCSAQNRSINSPKGFVLTPFPAIGNIQIILI